MAEGGAGRVDGGWTGVIAVLALVAGELVDCRGVEPSY